MSPASKDAARAWRALQDAGVDLDACGVTVPAWKDGKTWHTDTHGEPGVVLEATAIGTVLARTHACVTPQEWPATTWAAALASVAEAASALRVAVRHTIDDPFTAHDFLRAASTAADVHATLRDLDRSPVTAAPDAVVTMVTANALDALASLPASVASAARQQRAAMAAATILRTAPAHVAELTPWARSPTAYLATKVHRLGSDICYTLATSTAPDPLDDIETVITEHVTAFLDDMWSDQCVTIEMVADISPDTLAAATAKGTSKTSKALARAWAAHSRLVGPALGRWVAARARELTASPHVLVHGPAFCEALALLVSRSDEDTRPLDSGPYVLTGRAELAQPDPQIDGMLSVPAVLAAWALGAEQRVDLSALIDTGVVAVSGETDPQVLGIAGHLVTTDPAHTVASALGIARDTSAPVRRAAPQRHR